MNYINSTVKYIIVLSVVYKAETELELYLPKWINSENYSEERNRIYTIYLLYKISKTQKYGSFYFPLWAKCKNMEGKDKQS